MSKAARQRTARERLAEERKRQAQREKQRRALLISLSGLVVVALVVIVGVYVATKKEERSQIAKVYDGQLAPLSRDTDQSIVMAAAGVSTPVLEIFEDFQCPVCKDFEDAVGPLLKKLAAEGKVKVVYRPFQLFAKHQEPTRSNSLRGANAALCSPADKWISYHDALFKFQPSETEAGFKNADLVAWGRDVGITDPAFAKCVTDQQKKAQVDQATAYAGTRKVEGTPTVFLNGRKLENNLTFNPQALQSAIEAAPRTPATPATPGTTPSATSSATPSQ